MNMKNLAMWAVIVFLTIGLYNMFKNPQANVGKGNSIIFSEFLSEVDNGGVVKVDIQGNNIRGVLANGNTFSTYSPNYPNLIKKASYPLKEQLIYLLLFQIASQLNLDNLVNK